MANPATLQPQPFKKGYDPRRHKKQKGEVSIKTKIRNFIEDYFNYKKSKGVNEKEAIKELMQRFDKFSKKEARVLVYLADRIYGKEPDKFQGELEEKIKVDEQTKQLIEEFHQWLKKKK
ncbi:MAG: hypothetical protein DRO11_08980 [Methanobacteriota archaeon]|nr:MAG: hypothetical protein DRO11_08980 [Euryarchaeota archaeon]